MRQLTDRIGLGWRTPIAAQIFTHLEQVDVIEIIAEDFCDAGSKDLRGLRSLARERPLLVHGVALGLAGSEPLDQRCLDRLARLVNLVEPHAWSEHLAFVRAGGFEIGHLAAPPRTARSVAAALTHLEHIRRIVGQRPALENIATLLDPPASELSEPAWVSAILNGSDGNALLDLHNLYANALNFGIEPLHYLRQFPLHRVRMVHLSGGRMIELQDPGTGRRLRRVLDDHLHDVPAPVYEMLTYLGAHCPHPLDVILERDGEFPRFEHLIRQLDAARGALSSGRQARAAVRRSA